MQKFSKKFSFFCTSVQFQDFSHFTLVSTNLRGIWANQEQELLHLDKATKSSSSRWAEEPLVAVVHLEGGQLLKGHLLLQGST